MADPEDGRMNGEHVDEGVVHAWLDGQLSAADAARVESHIAGCAICAAMVAEAHGFMAASSRILTGLDGVPARVVPRSRSRARIWQVRAAAAVIVVALGAAAVLSDTGGRFQVRREPGVSDAPAAASPVPAPAETTDTAAATPPVTAASPLPSRSPGLVKPRAMVPEPPRQQLQENKKQMAFNERDAVARAGAQSGAMRKSAPAPSSDSARVLSTAPQAATLGARAAPPVREAAPAAAPPAVSRSAFAAKAAPSAVGGNAMQQSQADSSARANMTGTFSVGRLASNAAYRRCVGTVVTVFEPASTSAGAAAHLATVRLDSVAHSPPGRGFVVAASSGRANLDGWWVPVGADSAVVSLANPEPVPGAPAGDSAAADTAGAGASPATVTRVQCQSP